MNFYADIVKPVLFNLDPEFAHELTVHTGVAFSDWPLFSMFRAVESTQSQFHYKNLRFSNRVGLAAGFDKNAHYFPLMQQLGFGFLEIGSVTAQASEGNPKPRLFRLPTDAALINRMGLNNEGAFAITQRLSAKKPVVPFGINIAKTHSPSILGDAAIADYTQSFILSEPIADYITLNISCPNTEEGKTFEEPEALFNLLSSIKKHRTSAKPIFIKLSPDNTAEITKELVKISLSFEMDGFICSNTSSKREHLATPSQEINAIGKGGLSGKPILEKSIAMISLVKSFAPDSVLIGVGGICEPNDALRYVDSGADLIQVYTGMIYYGPALIRDIRTKLVTYYS